MPKKRRRAKIPVPAWERPRGALGRQLFGRSPRSYATAGIVALLLAALAVVGFAYWSDYQEDRNRPQSTAVRVGDTKYTLEHFTQRLKMLVQQLGGPGNQAAQESIAFPAVAQQLVQEAVVLRFAGEEDITATDEEIKNEIAVRLGLSADDPSFDVRFQEELTRSALTEEQYRDMARAAALTTKVRAKLEAGVPAIAESVHLRQIAVGDASQADDIKAQVEAGADFAQLAAERSLDTASKDKGGDVGWVPRGSLEKEDEDAVFALEPGRLTVVTSSVGATYVYQVLEKAADHEIDPTQKSRLTQRAFQDWLTKKQEGLEVKTQVLEDRDKYQWARSRAYSVL